MCRPVSLGRLGQPQVNGSLIHATRHCAAARPKMREINYRMQRIRTLMKGMGFAR
jgi:hypothetical protein